MRKRCIGPSFDPTLQSAAEDRFIGSRRGDRRGQVIAARSVRCAIAGHDAAVRIDVRVDVLHDVVTVRLADEPSRVLSKEARGSREGRSW